MAPVETPSKQIIARFGGIRPMARALGAATGRKVAPTTVQGWLDRGRVPATRQGDVLAAAAAAGVTLTPVDFFAPSETDTSNQDPPAMAGCELLTCAEMGQADLLTIKAGTPGARLMEAAGKGVARLIMERFTRVAVLVLCGPGNNGGDGFVIARILQRAGWQVRLALLGTVEKLQGDAALNAQKWLKNNTKNKIEHIDIKLLNESNLVVDALFGAGLVRPLSGAVRAFVSALNGRGVPVVAVDIPSGIDGDTGRILGAEEGAVSDGGAVQAALTVTFFRQKPGHLLYPGRAHCGATHCIDIGISPAVLPAVKPATFENCPTLWGDDFPWPAPAAHKYSRGAAVVCGGAEMTGAARLAARGAARMGAGLVTIAAVPEAMPIYQQTDAAILTTPLTARDDLARYLADPRRRAILVGPGYGVGKQTREHARTALELGKKLCLDADGLTSFADWPQGLFDAIGAASKAGGTAVLTPHDGEFARLFPDLRRSDRLARARAAAARSGAVVVLKGPDTVIAAPGGRAAINANAPAWLSTAGSGDVLAGLITGLLAQNVPAFAAAAIAVWIQGVAAEKFGPGLIADDLPGMIPPVLGELMAARAA
jgi:NAD(P)H-hydrate epimerase